MGHNSTLPRMAGQSELLHGHSTPTCTSMPHGVIRGIGMARGTSWVSSQHRMTFYTLHRMTLYTYLLPVTTFLPPKLSTHHHRNAPPHFSSSSSYHHHVTTSPFPSHKLTPDLFTHSTQLLTAQSIAQPQPGESKGRGDRKSVV